MNKNPNMVLVVEQKLTCLKCGWFQDGDYIEQWHYCPICGSKKLQQTLRGFRFEQS